MVVAKMNDVHFRTIGIFFAIIAIQLQHDIVQKVMGRKMDLPGAADQEEVEEVIALPPTQRARDQNQSSRAFLFWKSRWNFFLNHVISRDTDSVLDQKMSRIEEL